MTLPDGSRVPAWATRDVDGSLWVLLFGGPGTDKWCYGDPRWTSAADIQAFNLLQTQMYSTSFGALVLPASASKLSLFHSLAAFDAVRVVAAGTPFDFHFGSVNTVENLMFTTADTLVSGPTSAQWRTVILSDRTTSNDYFERGGSCANSALGCGSRDGCGQPLMFGYQYGSASTVNGGLGTNAQYCGGGGSCGVASGEWMAHLSSVFILGRLSPTANVTLSSS